MFDLGNGIYLLKNVDLFASISHPCCNVIFTSSTFAVFLSKILRNKSKPDKTPCSLSLNMTSSNRATNEPVNAKQFHFIFVFLVGNLKSWLYTYARTYTRIERAKQIKKFVVIKINSSYLFFDLTIWRCVMCVLFIRFAEWRKR